MQSERFSVKTDVFEGPLELLLSLIEARKLFIGDIALASVADDYIGYVRKLGAFPVADAANFILIASTLVLIKSKSLLPHLALTGEEERDIHELEERLRLYRRIKELSSHVAGRFGERVMYGRRQSDRAIVVFTPDRRLNPSFAASVMKVVIDALPKPKELARAVVRKVISLDEMIVNLTKRVTESMSLKFSEFAHASRDEKVRVVVSFLALLELVKRGIVAVRQDGHFSEIEMESKAVGTPVYK